MSEPRPKKCTHSICPVKTQHEDHVYEEEGDDLPYIVQAKAEKIRAAWDKGVDTRGWYDNVFLDKFFWVHGVETWDTAKSWKTKTDDARSNAAGDSAAADNVAKSTDKAENKDDAVRVVDAGKEHTNVTIGHAVGTT